MADAAITTLRTALATALTNAGVWNTFSYPPATFLANSVVIAPADPYLEPNNNTKAVSPTANFKIIMAVPALDNQGNLAQLETMMVGVFNKLQASSIPLRIGNLSTPAVLALPSGDLLTADLSVSTPTDWT